MDKSYPESHKLQQRLLWDYVLFCFILKTLPGCFDHLAETFHLHGKRNTATFSWERWQFWSAVWCWYRVLLIFINYCHHFIFQLSESPKKWYLHQRTQTSSALLKDLYPSPWSGNISTVTWYSYPQCYDTSPRHPFERLVSAYLDKVVPFSWDGETNIYCRELKFNNIQLKMLTLEIFA